jgi:hypothetical protein
MIESAFHRDDHVRYTGPDEAAAPVGDGIDGTIVEVAQFNDQPVYVIVFPDRMDPVMITGDDEASRWLTLIE